MRFSARIPHEENLRNTDREVFRRGSNGAELASTKKARKFNLFSVAGGFPHSECLGCAELRKTSNRPKGGI